MLVVLFACACRTPAPKSEPKHVVDRAGSQRITVPPAGVASVSRVASAEQLPLGVNATAKLGDYRLENADVEIFVDSLGGKQGFAATGGNVIDARLKPTGVDALNQTFLYLDETFPRQAYWRTIETATNANDGSASITVAGEDTNDPTLKFSSTYTLPAHGPVLTMTTRVTNKGNKVVSAFELGDCLQWGKTEHFAPTVGYEMQGKRLDVPWVVGVGDGVSYGVVSKTPLMSSFSGASWTDVVHKAATLGPGESASFERYFIVGAGDVTSVLDHYATYTPPGAPLMTLGRLHGVVSQSNGEQVVNGELTFMKGDQPFATTKCVSGGFYDAALPAGEYDVVVTGAGLRSKQRERVVIGERSAEKNFVVESGGTIRFSVKEGDQPVAAKLTVLGTNGTMNPVFGKPFQASGAMNVALTMSGSGEVKLPAGTYKLYASRGVEYDLAESELTVESNKSYDVALVLKHVVDTRGYTSGDFHQHQRNSFDSAMSLEDRVITNLAEGLELMVPTDHDFITDYRPVLAQMKAPLVTVSGVEATTHTLGHFGAFPIKPRPDLPRNGAPDTWNKKVKDIFADLRGEPTDKVLQINHPRAEMTGYFDAQHLDAKTGESVDPDFAWDFDAVEVLNGKRIKDAEKVIVDWMHLLSKGKRVTATGNSDSHNVVFQEVGYPRNFIRMPEPFNEKAFVEAVKKKHAIIVTNGPFIELFAGEASAPAQVGDSLAVKAGEVTLLYKLQAAPWVDVSSLELWQDGAKIFTLPVPASKNPLRAEGMHKLQVTKDSYVFAVVRGEKSLDPVVPTFRNKPSKPFAVTNPIYFTIKKR
ncbi:MAG: CehA/McbA family metallohydrolase [Deltaproteobacteria bacterium]|nr:CehA/McbA family metallohydrolase [Deltaproteobacteria bacterium]